VDAPLDDKQIQLTLAKRHIASVAAALRLAGRPDSSFEYVGAQNTQAETAAPAIRRS
jgi:hypothetical protein